MNDHLPDDQRIICIAIHLAYALRELAEGDVFGAGKSSGLAWQNSWGFSCDSLIERSQQLCRALDQVARSRQ